ncbi:MAG: DUF421 domain-containing protein [Candidatus Zixiibacteriota bacterium]|nr:MAG: DUF421 domain-containing protein [candidate division Zixibacteria bacterium]
MFFNTWADLFRVLLIGVLAYAGLVILLRVSGKRTLSKMNAFDLIITVALGSTLATAILSKQTALAESLTAFAVLVALQYVVAWSSTHWGFFNRLVKSEPKLLYYQGTMLRQAMRQERVVEVEMLQAVRSSGFSSLADVDAVIIETDGSFSVVSTSGERRETALQDVRGMGENRRRELQTP